MRLLTCLGTIIRLERETDRLTHAALAPVRDIAVDFVMALPPQGLAGPLEGPGGMLLLPGRAPGTLYLTRDDLFLSVDAAPYPTFSRELPGAPETLRLIDDDDVTALRSLLTHAWLDEDTREILQPGDITVAPGPLLFIGGKSLALGAERLGLDPADPESLTLMLDGAPVRLRRVPGSLIDMAEIAITPGNLAHLPAVRDETGFRAEREARFVLPAPSETGMPPILGSVADRAFLYCRGVDGAQPVHGRRQLHSDIVRQRDKFLLLEGALAGMVLDRAQVSRGDGIAGDPAAALPPYVRREGSQFFLDLTLLDTAPVLAGPHVLFTGPSLTLNESMIGDMIRLNMMAPYLPPDTALLFPASAGAPDKYLELLNAFGVGQMPRTIVAGPVVQLEELYWPARCTMAQMPASALRAARAHVQSLRPAPAARRTRIYVRSTGKRSVANAPLVEALLVKQRFKPVTLQDLDLAGRIDLFSQADIVVAPHGAALENILFCPPGARVLELSPDCQYRPVFNDMAGKLALTHAVLPCPTDDGTFDGRLNVPAGRLGLLADLLLSRQAA